MTERASGLSRVGVGVFYGAMAAIAYGVSMWRFDEPPVRVWGDPWPPFAGAALGLAVGVAAVLASRWSSGRFAWARRLDRNFASVLGKVSMGDAAYMALLSGLAEEMVFRGVVLRWLAEGATAWLPPESGAIALGLAALLSSLAFGLLHIGPDRSYLPWTVMATVVGVAFAAMTLWTGDITAAVVAHVTINYFNFLAIGRA